MLLADLQEDASFIKVLESKNGIFFIYHKSSWAGRCVSVQTSHKAGPTSATEFSGTTRALLVKRSGTLSVFCLVVKFL